MPTAPVVDVRVLVAAPGQLRLHHLLMLNFGMTQADISDLKPGEVDWTNGRIRRRRSKTEDHARVPIVDYPLWEETWRLLQKFGQREGERVLLTESGRRWVCDMIKPDGKRSKVDAIKSNDVHLQRKTKIAYPIMVLRKTSANLLETNHERNVVTMCLGHAPDTIADWNYVAPTQKKFDRAILWLSERYGIPVN